MGGELKFRSALGKGSTFWIDLALPVVPPTVDAGSSAIHANDARPMATGPSLDVLVAEDNQVNRLLIEALLRRMGHRVTCALDGEAAVGEAARRCFDLILMDMQMPRLDGLSAARAIRRADGPSAAAPIVALTADALPQRRFIYAVDEIDGFLAKPIDSAALTSLIAKLTRQTPVKMPAEPCASDDIDCRQLREIRQALGPARTTQLLTLFAQELASRPAAIREALGRSDLAAAAAEAHSLKGASLSIGGRTVGRAAAAIERALEATGPGCAGRLHAALRDLDRAVASTIAALPHELVAAPCAA
jgi:CheY-like chemotaxis protein